MSRYVLQHRAGCSILPGDHEQAGELFYEKAEKKVSIKAAALLLGAALLTGDVPISVQ